MPIILSKDSFPEVKLFVAIPMYGGNCMSNCLQGMMDLSSACVSYQIPMTLHGVVNESLVQRARNVCVDAFLESDFTHFLFIDADIGFTALDVLTLLYILSSDKEEKYDILAGPYPKKAISWKKVKRAVEKGFGDKEPSTLANYAGDYTFILSPSQKSFPLDEPAEVLEVGTGFMMIPRRTFEKFKQTYPKNAYIGMEGKKQFAFFDCIINPDTGYIIGEDCLFCLNVRKMGGKVWIAPWLNLTHQGLYKFKESYTPSFV